MAYHLSLTFSTPNCTGQLKNIYLQGPPWSILLHNEIMPSALPQYSKRDPEVAGIQTEEGQQQVWQKESTHTNKTHIQPPQLQQQKELIHLGKGSSHRNKSYLTIRTRNSYFHSYYCMNAMHLRS